MATFTDEKDNQILTNCFDEINPNYRTSTTLPNDLELASNIVSSSLILLLEDPKTIIRNFVANENYLNAIGLLTRKESKQNYYSEPLAESICGLSKNLDIRKSLFENKNVLLGMSEVARAFSNGSYSLQDLNKYFAVNEIEGKKIAYIGKSLGKGATAIVVLANLQTQNTGWFSFFRSRPTIPVAVKILKSDFNFAEIFFSSAIQHHSFLKFYGYTIEQKEEEGTIELLLVMEYAQHGSLKDFILNKKLEFTPNLKKRLLIQFFEGLSFLHNLGIVHRDIKPENCMIVEREGSLYCCITDLGSAKGFSPSGSVNLLSTTGTGLYHAPEIFKNNLNESEQNNFSKECDIYSSGYIIYLISETEIPYYALEKQQLGTIKLTDISIQSNIPQRIEISPNNCCLSLMEGCWRFNPNERITVQQILQQLQMINF
eukprot:TRINITY_DN587_c0_g1_i1.p1 TRINITY_DN587_c0_g1~~TRINITY_DN587_c0_g1_i1.p1  ORF type:complete len:429 (-),score=158.12 TRINITY_DN587_c0_g1_i1:58-1344(-)